MERWEATFRRDEAENRRKNKISDAKEKRGKGLLLLKKSFLLSLINRYFFYTQALSLGYSSIEEYDAKMIELKTAAAQLDNSNNTTKRKGGLTEEGRMRISESLKKRWQDPVFRAAYSVSNRLFLIVCTFFKE